MGEGAGGMVLKASDRKNKQVYAIKKIDCSFNDLYHMKYVLREITILRQLSMNKNKKMD